MKIQNQHNFTLLFSGISLSATLSTTDTIEQHSMNLNQPSTSSKNNYKRTKLKANMGDNDNDEDAFQRPSFSSNSQALQQESSNELDKHITTHTNKIPDTGFIIFETLTENNDLQILHTSAAKQGTVIKFQFEADDKDSNK